MGKDYGDLALRPAVGYHANPAVSAHQPPEHLALADREIVEQWLTDSEIGFTSEDPGPGFTWALLTEGSPFRITIARRDVEHPHIQLQARIAISPEHRSVLEQVDDDARDAFVFDLRIALLQKPIGQSMEIDEDGRLVGVVLGYSLLEEHPSRAGFFRRHHQIQSGGLLVSQFFQKLTRFRRWPV